MPSVDYSPGVRARGSTCPISSPAGDDTDILLTPSLMSRQGLLVAGAEWDQRFVNGAFKVKASGHLPARPRRLCQPGRSAIARLARLSADHRPVHPDRDVDGGLVLHDLHRRRVPQRLPFRGQRQGPRQRGLRDAADAQRIFRLPGAAVQPARQRHAGAAGLAGPRAAECELPQGALPAAEFRRDRHHSGPARCAARRRRYAGDAERHEVPGRLRRRRRRTARSKPIGRSAGSSPVASP